MILCTLDNNAKMQSPPKPQFASWLIEQLRTGQYQGLCYVGPNRFRVPWKHNSRKDCNDEDGKIFKAWAEASGKIHEFPNDKARWKTNFRCALNNLQSRFKKIEDNSKSDDPHKVYEIISPESVQMQSSQEDSDPDIYCSPTDYFPNGCEMNLLNDMKALDINNTVPGTMQFDYLIPNTSPYVASPVVPSPGNNIEMGPEPPVPQPNPNQFTTLQTPDLCDLEITINYRKKEMLKQTVKCQTLQLHYPLETQDANVQYPICFPSTESLIDHKQIEYTNRILNSIQRGLFLEVNESGIYAYRQDRCHVFASTTETNEAHPDPQKLPLNRGEQLFCFQKFVQELKCYRENGGRSPEYTIKLCFGEKFPDGRALDRKLIVVKVVPLICRYFHEQAQMDGASSLHSSDVSLQISHNSLMDLINSVFGPPTVEDPVFSQCQYIQQG